MLVAESIWKHFPTRGADLTVLRDVSLSLEAGESAVVMGPSGSGKSTLLNILGTLERPTAGRVTLDGCDPFSLSDRELARFRNRRVGFIFQEHHLLPQCSALENVLLPTLPARRDDFPPATVGATLTPGPVAGREHATFPEHAGALDRASELLARVGLSDRLEYRPAELSGGERQRVAIARALINRPALLLADEPTGNLDRTTAQRVGDLLAELHREQQAVLLVATHSQLLADRFGRRFDLIDGTLVPR